MLYDVSGSDAYTARYCLYCFFFFALDTTAASMALTPANRNGYSVLGASPVFGTVSDSGTCSSSRTTISGSKDDASGTSSSGITVIPSDNGVTTSGITTVSLPVVSSF